MNRQTILTRNRSRGSNITCKVTRAQSSRSHTIDTFSTTLRAGFLNSIVAKEFHGKGTTRRGSSKNRNACDVKKSLKVNDRKLSNVNSSGFACRQKHDMQKVKQGSIP